MIHRTISLAAAGLALAATAAQADYSLTLLHINDLHSRIEPITKYDGTCSAEDDAEGKCFGGVARVKTYLDARRAALASQNVLTLDAGDQFQGSMFYTTYKGDAAAEFMNAIGFDVMAVGNHEFDDGPEKLRAFMDKVNFPVISGNTVVATEPLLKDQLQGYVIFEIGGETVAVVSVLASDTAETSSPGPNIGFEDEIRYLNSVVQEIERLGVNKIIALTHVGLPRDLEIAAKVPGVDVVIGGHSHTYLSASDPKRKGAYPTWVTNEFSGDLVPVVQAYAYSKYVGELTVDFDDAGKVVWAEGDTTLLDASITPDAAIAARVAELGAPIEELKATVVGETTAPIDGDRSNCRARECEMGVLVAEAMLDRVKDQGISIAIQNGGGLRASIDAGQVTMGDVLTVLPFQNTLATFQLKGADVVAALENGVSQVEDGKGRFPQVAGLRYAWDISVAPGAGRIKDVEVMENGAWRDIDPEKLYGVVSNNFMRSGGDGYGVFASNGLNAYDFGPGLEQVVADYIAANSPYQPELKGAIIEGGGFDAAPAAAATEEAPAPAAEAAEEETGAKFVKAPAAAEAAETTAAEAAPELYVVQSGDTLWGIAAKLLGDGNAWPKIAEANGLSGGASLAVGQELKLPR